MKILFILFTFIYINTFAQQEMKVIATNVGFGSLTGGIGAVINKKPNDDWKKVFLQGFWQGGIGGLLNYSGKKTIHLIDEKQNLIYAFPARVLSAAGNSIIQNAALNKPFLQNWSFDYMFFHFDYSLHSDSKVRIRLLPASIIGSAMAWKQSNLDVPSSLLSGIMIFKSNQLINSMGTKTDGVNYGRAFMYYNDTLQYHIIAHEIVHEFQYREHIVFNTYFKQSAAKTKVSALRKIIRKYVYPDIPYFGIAYLIEGTQATPYYFRNYFEFEAEYFATNSNVLYK